MNNESQLPPHFVEVLPIEFAVITLIQNRERLFKWKTKLKKCINTSQVSSPAVQHTFGISALGLLRFQPFNKIWPLRKSTSFNGMITTEPHAHMHSPEQLPLISSSSSSRFPAVCGNCTGLYHRSDCIQNLIRI